jgi:hypothetical protein
MVTTREWWRQGLRAWSASALVPVAVLVAVAVLAIGGGVGGVRRLGQLFGGPTVPSPVRSAGNVDVQTERRTALPHVPARVMAGAAAATRAVHATPVHAAPRRTTAPPAHRQPTAHRSPGSSKPVGTAPRPQPSKPVTTAPPPPPPPPKTITRRVGDAVDQVVAPVPVVGPTATTAIDTVVTTVDKVLPVPPQVAAGPLGPGAQ